MVTRPGQISHLGLSTGSADLGWKHVKNLEIEHLPSLKSVRISRFDLPTAIAGDLAEGAVFLPASVISGVYFPRLPLVGGRELGPVAALGPVVSPFAVVCEQHVATAILFFHARAVGRPDSRAAPTVFLYAEPGFAKPL